MPLYIDCRFHAAYFAIWYWAIDISLDCHFQIFIFCCYCHYFSAWGLLHADIIHWLITLHADAISSLIFIDFDITLIIIDYIDYF